MLGIECLVRESIAAFVWSVRSRIQESWRYLSWPLSRGFLAK